MNGNSRSSPEISSKISSSVYQLGPRMRSELPRLWEPSAKVATRGTHPSGLGTRWQRARLPTNVVETAGTRAGISEMWRYLSVVEMLEGRERGEIEPRDTDMPRIPRVRGIAVRK